MTVTSNHMDAQLPAEFDLRSMCIFSPPDLMNVTRWIEVLNGGL